MLARHSAAQAEVQMTLGFIAFVHVDGVRHVQMISLQAPILLRIQAKLKALVFSTVLAGHSAAQAEVQITLVVLAFLHVDGVRHVQTISLQTPFLLSIPC